MKIQEKRTLQAIMISFSDKQITIIRLNRKHTETQTDEEHWSVNRLLWVRVYGNL